MTRLLIARKLSAEDPGVVTSFREIERWANSIQITRFAYAAGWADIAAAGYAQGGFFADPFGLVHLLGELQFTGTVNAGVFSNITTLPPVFAPPANQVFAALLTIGAATMQPATVFVLPTGVISVITTANIVNPNLSLAGFTYPPFK